MSEQKNEQLEKLRKLATVLGRIAAIRDRHNIGLVCYLNIGSDRSVVFMPFGSDQQNAAAIIFLLSDLAKRYRFADLKWLGGKPNISVKQGVFQGSIIGRIGESVTDCLLQVYAAIYDSQEAPNG